MRRRQGVILGHPVPRALPERGWDDVTNSAFRTRRGTNDKPDFDYTNFGLAFPEDDESEIVYITDQMRHAWAGSDGSRTEVHPHIHLLQSSAAIPVFELQYRFYNNGASVPSMTTIDTSDGPGAVFTWATGTLLQIIRFPTIELEGLGSSTWYDMMLYRQTGDGVTGDVVVKGFDWHARFDALGSRDEYRK